MRLLCLCLLFWIPTTITDNHHSACQTLMEIVLVYHPSRWTSDDDLYQLTQPGNCKPLEYLAVMGLAGTCRAPSSLKLCAYTLILHSYWYHQWVAFRAFSFSEASAFSYGCLDQRCQKLFHSEGAKLIDNTLVKPRTFHQ